MKKHSVVPGAAFAVVTLLVAVTRADAQSSVVDQNVTQVATGGSHRCAVLTTSNLVCWGHNAKGELGSGTTDSSPVPVDV